MIMVEYDRNSPHRSGYYQVPPRDNAQFTHLDHNSSPSTPSPPYHYAHVAPPFGQPPSAASVRSTPTSYPSPASYPSPSISASFSYPPPQGQHSPHFQPMSVPPYSLPPIRMTPPIPSATSAPQTAPQQIGSPMPSHMYYPASHPHGIPTAPISHHQSSNSPMRYPLPQVTPERIMSGGRHKKEIKRRTKTGCLTCRKRRIKCDEAHPTCKNCAKSKRDCLGYDPIFKAQPGPAPIQPAPSSGLGPAPIAPNPLPYVMPNPQSAIVGYGQPISTAGSSPASSCEPYDYPAIDPSLEASAPVPGNPNSIGGLLAHTGPSYRSDLKRAFDRTSPLSCISDTPRTTGTPIERSLTPNPTTIQDVSGMNPAKRVKISDLLTEGAPTLPLTPPSLDNPLQEMSTRERNLDPQTFVEKASSKLDDFYETGWFTATGRKNAFVGEKSRGQLENYINKLSARNWTYIEEEDPTLDHLCGNDEVYIVALRTLYGVQASAGANKVQETSYQNLPPNSSLALDLALREETLARVKAVEALVSGKNMQEIFDIDGRVSSKFWTSLGRFVSLSEGRDREETFRQTLSDMEKGCYQSGQELFNRRALFILAKARHIFSQNRPVESNIQRECRERVEEAKEQVKRLTRPNTVGYVDTSIVQRLAGRMLAFWGEPIYESPILL